MYTAYIKRPDFGRLRLPRPSAAASAQADRRPADLERLGFVTRVRRIRQIKTPLGFTTRQITNAYRVGVDAASLFEARTLAGLRSSACHRGL
jgi:hypothetical protein